jgi:hypothetical protein
MEFLRLTQSLVNEQQLRFNCMSIEYIVNILLEISVVWSFVVYRFDIHKTLIYTISLGFC